MGGILLVGEDRDRGRGIRSILRQDGHGVAWTRSVDEWREAERELHPDLVVAAVASADPILRVRGRSRRGFGPPLLFVQHETDFFREVHLEERLVDRLQSPFNAEELLARVDALIRLRRMIRRDAADSPRRPTPAVEGLRKVALGIVAALRTRVPKLPKPRAPYLEVVARLAVWADRRDMFEPGHAERVTSLAAMMADGLGLSDDEASSLLRAAMLHDLGKAALPADLLRQAGPLAEEQMRIIRTHPERGAALLYAVDPDEAVARAILYHHERVDGTGYYGRNRENLPRAACILAVAETYDAMTTSRVRETLSSERALGWLRDRRGSHFDADCVDALVAALQPRPTRIVLSPVPPILQGRS